MKANRKKILAATLCTAMMFSLLPQGLVSQAAEADYEIYPTPHEMTYQDGSFAIGDEVNIVYDSTIDDVTKNRLEDVVGAHTVSDEKKDGVVDVLVGTYGSDEYVDTYVQEAYDLDESVFDEISGHYVISNDEEIVVLAVDTDAAFYGVTSLKHVFNQLVDGKIRNFTIKDYSDTSIRGFIEGYYGIPWSNEDRMSLMEFGGEFKMTSYVFAPKDDPYHTSKWRELYPEEELDAIKEMVEVGNNAKCHFVWTAHPFMGGFNSNDVDGEIEALLNKFEQLYSVGVRQFGVLGDDVGSLNRTIVIRVMNAVSEWANEKGDVYDSVFCPAGYNHAWQGNYSELNDYDAGFPDDVQIFWTGEAVCQPVEVKTLDHFRNYNAVNGQRRAPLFWLNWPVNDINMSRLMMGKGSLLHTDVNPDDLVGVVTNPMQDAECSKVAIFAVADYTWNIAGFDDDQSWADSFKYIDADAADELHTLAKHMSNPQPNGHGLILAESEELQPLINEFKTKLANGESLAGTSEELIAQMDVIIAACEGFHEKSKNEKMKEEILPFSESLKDLAAGIKYYTVAAQELENEDQMAAFEAFMKGYEAYANSKNHMRKTLSGTRAANPGSTHLVPLAEAIEAAISDEITAYALGDAAAKVKMTGSSSFTSFYQGSNDSIVDGDESTHAWHDGYEAAGQYYQVNMSRPVTVYGIDVLNGSSASGKGQDTFGNAKLQYTTDGTTWEDVNGEIYSNYQEHVVVEDLEIENVVAVRYICTSTGSGRKWPSMREFKVIIEKEEPSTAYTNAEAYKEAGAVYGTDTHSLNPIEVTLAEGEYIGLKLDRIHELADIVINDEVLLSECMTCQISMNGLEWEDVTGKDVSGKPARYIRLLKCDECEDSFDITEFVVHTTEVYGKSLESTNFSSISGDELAVFDGDWTTATQYCNSQIAGKYFVYDLGAEIEFDSLKVVCTDSEWDFPRHGKFSVSADGNEWTDIMFLGNQDGENEGESTTEDEIGSVLPDHEISYNTKKVEDLGLTARYLKFELTRTKTGADKWVRFQELEINDGAYLPTSNDPTYEGPGESFETQYANMSDFSLSTAYTPAETSGEFVYHVSEPGMNNVKIIQNTISNAKVQVRTIAHPDKWVTLGTLDKSICVLQCDGTNTTDILDVKITWEDTKLNLIELMALAGENGSDTPEPIENPFTDVNEEDFFFDAVLWAVENDITAGWTETLFAPDVVATRSQVVTFLWRAEKCPIAEADAEFTDVSEDDYYADAVAWAVEEGITNGWTETLFAPNMECTRGQVVTFLWRAKGCPETDVESGFEDVAEDAYYADAVAWAVANGITDGVEEAVFNPEGVCTRGEIVTFLHRTNIK
ncbi:MAG: beta-N-acetylglucosaminidase domain-containing protein [Lachnospiraceae bacterium]